jgi:hypothetical protein
MANTPTLIGTTVIVGFPTNESMTGIIRSSYDKEPTADLEYIKDESNNDASAVVSNLGMRIVVDGVASAENTTAKGDVLTVGIAPETPLVEYIVEAITRRHVPLATRLSLTLYRPTAMDPTP